MKKAVVTVFIILSLLIIAAAFLRFIYFPQKDKELKESFAEGEYIDLQGLYEKNQDIIGWIKVEGTNISYPVMRNADYYRKDFDGNYDIKGLPFTQDLWDEKTLSKIIYGHNMQVSGDMFYQIHKFEDESFFREHEEITLYEIVREEGGIRVYENTYTSISVCLILLKEFDITRCGQSLDEREVSEYEEEVLKRSMHKRAAEGVACELITLCTCSYHNKDDTARIILCGKLKERKDSGFRIIP